MAPNLAAMRSELQKKLVDELRIIGRKLKVKGYRKLAKANLIEELCAAPSGQLESALQLKWWDRNQGRIYGWASIIGVPLAIIGIVLGTLFYLWSADFEEQAKVIAQIDAQRAELQLKLDEEVLRSTQFARGVERITGRADAISGNPKIRRMAASLKMLLSAYDSRFGNKAVREEDDLRLRLARATVANAEWRYADALTVITEDDVEAQAEETAEQIEREVALRRVRADAYSGLQQWEAALPHYQQIIALTPSDIAARMSQANCFYYLNRLAEARRTWDAVLVELTERYRHGGEDDDGAAKVATAFANRASVVGEQGNLDEAIVNLAAARDMFRRILEQRPTEKAAVDLGNTVARLGDVLGNRGNHKQSLATYDEALRIFRSFKEASTTESDQVDAALAQTLHNRATVLIEQNRLDDAVAGLDEAIAIYRKLAGPQADAPEAGSLANALTTRVIASQQLGEIEAAEDYANEAVALLQRLVSGSGRADLQDDLAYALRVRSRTRVSLLRMREAGDDLKAALEMYEVAYKHGRPELLVRIAACLADYGCMLVDQHTFFKVEELLMEAQKVLGQAAVIYENLVGNGRAEFMPQLANVLTYRATAAGRQKDLESASKDANRAVKLLQPLVDEGRNDLRDDLAHCLTNAACVHGEMGLIDDAVKLFRESITIERSLIEDGFADFEARIAVALMLRGRVFANASRKEEAIKYLESSVAILNRFVDDGHEQLTPQFDRAKRHLELAKQGMPLD